jgi:hypothetical protein
MNRLTTTFSYQVPLSRAEATQTQKEKLLRVRLGHHARAEGAPNKVCLLLVVDDAVVDVLDTPAATSQRMVSCESLINERWILHQNQRPSAFWKEDFQNGKILANRSGTLSTELFAEARCLQIRRLHS